jgi:tetratricopeptide (TPR) repeat protein
MPKLPINNKKIVLIAAGSLLVILVLALVIIKMIPSNGNEDELPSLETTQDKAQSYIDSGDIDGGLKFYDEQIEARKDENEKKILLVYKANFAQSAGRFNEALEIAQQADAVAADISTSRALAQAYEAQGNKEQALIYYKKLLELSPKEGMGARYNPIWEEKIQELEQ